MRADPDDPAQQDHDQRRDRPDDEFDAPFIGSVRAAAGAGVGRPVPPGKRQGRQDHRNHDDEHDPVELIRSSRSAEAIGPCGSNTPVGLQEARTGARPNTGQRRRERQVNIKTPTRILTDSAGPQPRRNRASQFGLRIPLRPRGRYRGTVRSMDQYIGLMHNRHLSAAAQTAAATDSMLWGCARLPLWYGRDRYVRIKAPLKRYLRRPARRLFIAKHAGRPRKNARSRTRPAAGAASARPLRLDRAAGFDAPPLVYQPAPPSMLRLRISRDCWPAACISDRQR